MRTVAQKIISVVKPSKSSFSTKPLSFMSTPDHYLNCTENRRSVRAAVIVQPYRAEQLNVLRFVRTRLFNIFDRFLVDFTCTFHWLIKIDGTCDTLRRGLTTSLVS